MQEKSEISRTQGSWLRPLDEWAASYSISVAAFPCLPAAGAAAAESLLHFHASILPHYEREAAFRCQHARH